MKEKILNLRLQGKTYNQIKEILGCSKSTISFHCGEGQKEKNKIRGRKYKSNNYLFAKVDAWGRNRIKLGVRNFKVRKTPLLKNNSRYFTHKDVIEKFGYETQCYLSGEKINLVKDNKYSLDHIVAVARGGDNSLNNMGILTTKVNKMKSDLSIEEFIETCVKVLKYNGYSVKKIKRV